MGTFVFIIVLILSSFISPLNRAAVFSSPSSRVLAQQDRENNMSDVRLPENKTRTFWMISPLEESEITAPAALVIDAHSGDEIWHKGDVVGPYPIASLTKLMTARIVKSFLSGNGPFEILPEDYDAIGRKELEVGKQYLKDDLFAALLVDSSNTAAHILLRLAGLSRESFRARALEEAYRLGLTMTEWDEPTGLSPKNKASARDVATLLYADLQDSYLNAFLRRAHYTLSTGDTITTTNLLRVPGDYEDARVVAGKTGYIEESGFSVAVLGRCASKQEVMVVVLGSATHFDRFRDVERLVDWTCSHTRWLASGSSL